MGDIIEVKEKPSSVEVNKNAKGEIAIKVKIYFDAFTDPWLHVNEEIEEIIKDIEKREL